MTINDAVYFVPFVLAWDVHVPAINTQMVVITSILASKICTAVVESKNLEVQ